MDWKKADLGGKNSNGNPGEHWFKATTDAADKGTLYSVCSTSALSERILPWSWNEADITIR